MQNMEAAAASVGKKETCPACQKEVTADDDSSSWKGSKTYHSECLACGNCNAKMKLIDGMPFHASGWWEKDGLCFCGDCHGKVGVLCGECYKPALSFLEPFGKGVIALHPECFTCGQCRTPLNGKPFLPIKEKKMALCAECSKSSQQRKGFTIDPRTGKKKYVSQRNSWKKP